MTQDLLKDLALAKVTFQLRSILFAMGNNSIEISKLCNPDSWAAELHDNEQCAVCGDRDCIGGLSCKTGDGV